MRLPDPVKLFWDTPDWVFKTVVIGGAILAVALLLWAFR